MFGEIRLSRIQLLVIVILIAIVIIVGMKLSSEDNQKHDISISDRISQHKDSEISQPTSTVALQNQQYQEALTRQKIDEADLENIHQAPLGSSENTMSNQSFSSLDDESLLMISDILENSLVPAFLSPTENSDSLTEQNAAIDVFISRLPEGLDGAAFQQINALLRDYLPYDMADDLALQTEKKYRLNEQEQAYLAGALPNNTSPETMEAQIAIAQHLHNLKGGSIKQETDIEPSQNQQLSAWKNTEEKLAKIKSSPNNSKQDIHIIITDEYGSQVADDYIELSNIENKWQEKYAAFQIERDIVSASGLSDEDKAEQTESLIQQHYDENEWAAARGYDELLQAKSKSED